MNPEGKQNLTQEIWGRKLRKEGGGTEKYVLGKTYLMDEILEKGDYRYFYKLVQILGEVWTFI